MPDISSLFCHLLRSQTEPALESNLLFKSQINKELWAVLFAKPFSILSANTVDNVFCSGCEENCYMPVEQIRKYDETIVNVVACDKKDNIGFVELDKDEVKPHKFNMLVFCNSLSKALKSHDEAKTLIPDLLYKIGRCQINESGYTVFLAINLEDEAKIKNNTEYQNAVKPVIISVNDIPNNTALPCVLIDSVIYIDKNQDFGIFDDSITSLYKDNDATDKNIFKKEGSNWRICYNGKLVWVKHTKGCYYVAELLNNPNKEINAKDLQAIVDKFELPDEQYKDMSEEELENEGMSVHVESPEDVIAKDLLATYRNNLKTIDADIEEAEGKGMTTKANQLKQQKTGMEDFICKSTNIKGESRKIPDASEKARQAVNRAINTAIKNIGNELPELSLHLKSHITKGHTCQYTPEENLNWHI